MVRIWLRRVLGVLFVPRIVLLCGRVMLTRTPARDFFNNFRLTTVSRLVMVRMHRTSHQDRTESAECCEAPKTHAGF